MTSSVFTPIRYFDNYRIVKRNAQSGERLPAEAEQVGSGTSRYRTVGMPERVSNDA